MRNESCTLTNRRRSDGMPLDGRHGSISGLCDGSSWYCITKRDALRWFDLTRFCTTHVSTDASRAWRPEHGRLSWGMGRHVFINFSETRKSFEISLLNYRILTSLPQTLHVIPSSAMWMHGQIISAYFADRYIILFARTYYIYTVSQLIKMPDVCYPMVSKKHHYILYI